MHRTPTKSLITTSSIQGCAEVGDQTPALTNTTGSGNKNFVQQVFHPSLFVTRPTSASSGGSSDTIPPSSLQAKSKESSTQSVINQNPNPPLWQRITVNGNTKKRKLSRSPSPDAVQTASHLMFWLLTSLKTSQKYRLENILSNTYTTYSIIWNRRCEQTHQTLKNRSRKTSIHI